MLEVIRLGVASLFILGGVFILGVATFGIFRFQYVLNRIHVAAKCDTLGTLLLLTGMGIVTGVESSLWKLGLLLIFLWIANPVASHLIGRVEVTTNDHLEEECEVITK